MYKRYTVFIILFLVTIAAQAQDSMISDISYPYLEKLITSAKSNYPRVKALKDRIDLAKIGVSKAGLSWFDFFTFSYIYQPNNTLNYTVPSTTSTTTNRFLFNGIQLGLSLNLGSLLLKPSNIKTAKTEVNIAGEEQNEYLITLTTDVKRRYFTYLLQQNLVKIQTQAYQDMQTSVKQTSYKFQKGEVPFETYNASLLSASTRAEQKLQAETNFFIAKSELEALIGAKLEDIK
ncbi:MAG: TolC family protein [Janthinobacterium lividum]